MMLRLAPGRCWLDCAAGPWTNQFELPNDVLKKKMMRWTLSASKEHKAGMRLKRGAVSDVDLVVELYVRHWESFRQDISFDIAGFIVLLLLHGLVTSLLFLFL